MYVDAGKVVKRVSVTVCVAVCVGGELIAVVVISRIETDRLVTWMLVVLVIAGSVKVAVDTIKLV